MSGSGYHRSSREEQLASEVRHLRAEVRRLTERVDEQADQISELSANLEEVSGILSRVDRSQSEEAEIVSSVPASTIPAVCRLLGPHLPFPLQQLKLEFLGVQGGSSTRHRPLFEDGSRQAEPRNFGHRRIAELAVKDLFDL